MFKRYTFHDYEEEVITIIGIVNNHLVVAKSYEWTTSDFGVEIFVDNVRILHGDCDMKDKHNWARAAHCNAIIFTKSYEECVIDHDDDEIPDDLSADEYYELIVSNAIEEAKASLKGEVIGRTASGEFIYRHPDSHSHRPDLDAEAIASVIIPEGSSFHRQAVDIGRTIGVDHLVETTEEDEIVYIRRGSRSGESRMVLNRSPKETTKVFVVLCKNNDEADPLFGEWCLVTLFEGEPGLPEPWSRGGDTEEAKAFWANHALVPTDEEWTAINAK